jgi:transporter family protein
VIWLPYAVGSAVFAGLTEILAKVGIRHTPSNLATAIRTGVVLVFAWLVVFIVGSQTTITHLSGKTILFLFLSGLATGGSWLCYFRALHLADVNQVAPVDKSSIILTVAFAIVLPPHVPHLSQLPTPWAAPQAIDGLGSDAMAWGAVVDGL